MARLRCFEWRFQKGETWKRVFVLFGLLVSTGREESSLNKEREMLSAMLQCLSALIKLYVGSRNTAL